MTETQHIAGAESERGPVLDRTASQEAVTTRERRPSLRVRLVIRDVLALALSTSLVVWAAPEAHKIGRAHV